MKAICMTAIGLLFAIAAIVQPDPSEARTRYNQTYQTTNYYQNSCGYCAQQQPQVRQVKRHYRHHAAKAEKHKKTVDANGNKASNERLALIQSQLHDGEFYNEDTGMLTVRTVYGFRITTHPSVTEKFLKLFELMKEAGYHVNPDIVGCYARDGHVRGSNHYRGLACDNQWSRNRGPTYVYHMGKMLRSVGLHDGCSFNDCGHWEAKRGTFNTVPNSLASAEKFLLARDSELKAWVIVDGSDQAEVKIAKAEPQKEEVEVSVKHKRVVEHHHRHHRRRYAMNVSYVQPQPVYQYPQYSY